MKRKYYKGLKEVELKEDIRNFREFYRIRFLYLRNQPLYVEFPSSTTPYVSIKSKGELRTRVLKLCIRVRNFCLQKYTRISFVFTYVNPLLRTVSYTVGVLNFR